MSPQLARCPTYSLPSSATQRQDRAGITQVPIQQQTAVKLVRAFYIRHYNCELYITFTLTPSLFQYCLLSLQLDLQAHLQAVLQLDLNLDLHVDLQVILQSNLHDKGQRSKVSYIISFKLQWQNWNIHPPIQDCLRNTDLRVNYSFRQSCDVEKQRTFRATFYMKLWQTWATFTYELWCLRNRGRFKKTDTSNFSYDDTDLQMIQIFSWTCNQFYMQIYIWIYTQIY